MVGHGGSSAGSYLADPTSPIPSHCASVVATSSLRVKTVLWCVVFGRLWLCTFTLAVSFGAVLLLPLSIVANEALIMFPQSYYFQWVNSSLIHGEWFVNTMTVWLINWLLFMCLLSRMKVHFWLSALIISMVLRCLQIIKTLLNILILKPNILFSLLVKLCIVIM